MDCDDSDHDGFIQPEEVTEPQYDLRTAPEIVADLKFGETGECQSLLATVVPVVWYDHDLSAHVLVQECSHFGEVFGDRSNDEWMKDCKWTFSLWYLTHEDTFLVKRWAQDELGVRPPWLETACLVQDWADARRKARDEATNFDDLD